MRNLPAIQRLIPITRIRHVYNLLLDFRETQFQLNVAREFRRRPDQLAQLVIESRTHFEFYDNREQGFHDRGNQGLLTRDRQKSTKLADVLLQQVAAVRDVNVAELPRCSFKYVDYDISPFRTTGSEFENGKPSHNNARGGIDVLLSNQQDQTPIVGEIKADTDVNPFSGLLQSLAYAVELSTPHQRARLNRFYQDRFAEWAPDTGIDIYLMLLRYPDDDRSLEFLDLTGQIAANLVANEGLSPIIRRIVALKNAMNQDALGPFTVAFAHGD